MASKKTKRMAAVTALSASLMVGGAAAFAHEDATVYCSRGEGHGFGTGHKDKGNGQANGWPQKCRNKGNPGENNNDENNNGGETTSDDHNISVEVNVEVNLPKPPVPNAATTIDSALDHAFSAAHQTVTLAESDVAGLMAIVEAAGQGATSLVDATTAQADVSVSGTNASGTVNVSSGAGGATTLGSNLADSTLNLVNGNITGAWSILGTMSSML